MLDSSKKRFKVPPRLDYLAVPSLEGGHDLKQSVRELLLSVIYEQMERDPASEVHLTLPNGVTTGSDLAMFQDDQLARYGWERHDGRSFGRQTLVDGSVTLTLSMVKVQGAGKGPGGDWAVRIKTSRTPKHAGPRAARVSLVMYLADEDTPKSAWRVLPGVVGEWSFHMLDSSKKRFKVPPRLDYLAVPSLEGGHDLKQSVRELLLSVIYEQMERDPVSEVHLTLPNGVTTGSDLAMF
ncbi:uncharacterized protein HaLaN_25716, partial [Haematococcus lacustris]